MTYDRTPFDTARDAELARRHNQRQAHQLATRIRASRYTHGDGDLTVYDADVDALAAEMLNLGDITDETATLTSHARCASRHVTGGCARPPGHDGGHASASGYNPVNWPQDHHLGDITPRSDS